ncbi:uncharacterized protein ARMOST_04480 [Armillaria ostoyae]|uniref:Uncharacterized protein n=1 Tax=Armillaria ostoyae TaxID=47428 RepID=A0A284QXP2_ARMOS|nr:uncharacterized protein ARMOST_04480 [Armillaria ostoyae]
MLKKYSKCWSCQSVIRRHLPDSILMYQWQRVNTALAIEDIRLLGVGSWGIKHLPPRFAWDQRSVLCLKKYAFDYMSRTCELIEARPKEAGMVVGYQSLLSCSPRCHCLKLRPTLARAR